MAGQVERELMPKLFHIRRVVSTLPHSQGQLVWAITRDVAAGWQWPSVTIFRSWEVAMAHVEQEILEYIIPELKAHGYSIRRDWDAEPATHNRRKRVYYICKNNDRQRDRRRKMVKAQGEEAAWHKAWRHYKGEM